MRRGWGSASGLDRTARRGRPERFPLATAGEHMAAPELSVTGVVSPDVSRQVPVPSLTTGRVVEINARLGDQVNKGQLLFPKLGPRVIEWICTAIQVFSRFPKAHL